MSQLTEAEIYRRRLDLTRFVDALRSAARQFQFGIETRGVEVEVYDRQQDYIPGKPFAVLLVDKFEVCKYD